MGILFIFFPLTGNGQVSNALERGDSLFGIGEFEEALVAYQAYSRKTPGDNICQIKMGKCCTEINDFRNAIPYFRKVAESENPIYSSYKMLGESLLHTGEYEEARFWFNQYENAEKSDEKIKGWKHVIDTLDYLLGKQMGYEISILTVNTPDDELSALMYEGGMIYSSSGELNPGSTANEKAFRMLFSEGSFKGKRGMFFKPNLMTGSNTEYQQLLPSVSPDGKSIVFVQYPKGINPLSFQENLPGVLMIGSLNKTGMESSVPLLESKPGIQYTTPSWSPDGKVLFFAANLPDSKGGLDIYYMMRTANGWDSPVNAGKNINTTGNDWFPLLDPTGKFYYSTEGFNNGQGGYDIFVSQTDSRMIFDPPQSLPYPLNTEGNEYYFNPVFSENSGFFSSDRKDGIGQCDIYYFTRGELDFPCQEPVEVPLCGKLWDENATNLDDNSFKYEWNLHDGTILKGDTIFHCFRRPGQHRIKMTVFEEDGITENSFSTRIIELPGVTQAVILSPGEASSGKAVTFDGEPSFLESFEIVSWKWDMGDGYWLSGEKVSHTYHRPGIYVVKLTVAGINERMKEVGKACMEKTIIIR